MTRILVLYGTTDGHTKTIAHTIADTLRIVHDYQVDVIKAGVVDPVMAQYSGVIVAGSIHGGRFQKTLAAVVRAHASEIASRPNAFVPVCLAVLQKNDPKTAADLDQIFKRFYDQSGWTPALTSPAAGALLYTRYNFLTRWMMKRIVAKRNGDTDTSRDYVYTDWAALRRFAADFGSQVRSAAAA